VRHHEAATSTSGWEIACETTMSSIPHRRGEPGELLLDEVRADVDRARTRQYARRVRTFAYALLASAFACGGSEAPGTDASTDGTSGAEGAADAEAGPAEASCGPPDPTLCQCSQPMGACCASINTVQPSCQWTFYDTFCLPSCNTSPIQCGTLNAYRPTCNSSSDCALFTGYQSCCSIACQPHRVSVCMTAAEAQGLTCL